MKAFISYNEDGNEVKGIFDLLEQNSNFIKIRSHSNIIIIPYHKINKIKIQELKGGI